MQELPPVQPIYQEQPGYQQDVVSQLGLVDQKTGKPAEHFQTSAESERKNELFQLAESLQSDLNERSILNALTSAKNRLHRGEEIIVVVSATGSMGDFNQSGNSEVTIDSRTNITSGIENIFDGTTLESKTSTLTISEVLRGFLRAGARVDVNSVSFIVMGDNMNTIATIEFNQFDHNGRLTDERTNWGSSEITITDRSTSPTTTPPVRTQSPQRTPIPRRTEVPQIRATETAQAGQVVHRSEQFEFEGRTYQFRGIRTTGPSFHEVITDGVTQQTMMPDSFHFTINEDGTITINSDENPTSVGSTPTPLSIVEATPQAPEVAINPVGSYIQLSGERVVGTATIVLGQEFSVGGYSGAFKFSVQGGNIILELVNSSGRSSRVADFSGGRLTNANSSLLNEDGVNGAFLSLQQDFNIRASGSLSNTTIRITAK